MDIFQAGGMVATRIGCVIWMELSVLIGNLLFFANPELYLCLYIQGVANCFGFKVS